MLRDCLNAAHAKLWMLTSKLIAFRGIPSSSGCVSNWNEGSARHRYLGDISHTGVTLLPSSEGGEAEECARARNAARGVRLGRGEAGRGGRACAARHAALIVT